MSDYLSIIILVIAAVSFAVMFFLLSKKNKDLLEKQKNDQSILMIQNQINDLNKTLDNKLGESTRSFQQQFGQSNQVIQGISNQSNKVISEISEKIATLERTNQQVVGITEKLQGLERILTSQKQRGNLGEAGLRLVLENILPPTAYKLQYEIDKDKRVDAAIFTKDGIIPVDAKFSLENYRNILEQEDGPDKERLEIKFKNDLKERINETSKYIQPRLGTLDFAFMFIPSEAIYYDLLVNEVGAVKVNTRNLIEYAFKNKRVIIVSPTTFAAYLQTVLHGLNALKIEKQTKEIITRVERLKRHMVAYDDYFKKVGTHLNTTVSSYNFAQKEFKKIDKDVVKITGQESEIEVLEIDKPKTD